MPSIQDSNSFTSRSDEELQNLTVEELKPHNAQITLVEYDPSWPKLFEQEANRIRSVLGKKALQIEHVGSTSVPGLCAKPIIDMLLVVEDSADEPSYVLALEVAGYTLRIREPEWFEHRLFKGPETDINLHVFSTGASEIERMLRFRDWLRNNETDRDKYAQVKRSLAKNKWRHVQHYADAKTTIVQEIMGRANDNDEEEKMSNHELYQAAFSLINHKKLRKFGTSGHVVCALETNQGNIFTGICIDLPCSIGLCAEQSAISEMVKNNETAIKRIVAVYEDGSILPPCGRCREFIAQIDDQNMETKIVLPEMKEVPLKDLLPERWDSKWD